jgi:hypothetical protein
MCLFRFARLAWGRRRRRRRRRWQILTVHGLLGEGLVLFPLYYVNRLVALYAITLTRFVDWACSRPRVWSGA